MGPTAALLSLFAVSPGWPKNRTVTMGKLFLPSPQGDRKVGRSLWANDLLRVKEAAPPRVTEKQDGRHGQIVFAHPRVTEKQDGHHGDTLEGPCGCA